jgi:hypothetical protein
MNERELKSFDLAADAVKQLLALATGVLGVTAAFAKDLVPATTTIAKRWLTGGWVLLLLSVIVGSLSLMTLSGQLGNEAIARPSIYAHAPRLFTSAQALLFVAGMIVLMVSAWLALP